MLFAFVIAAGTGCDRGMSEDEVKSKILEADSCQIRDVRIDSEKALRLHHERGNGNVSNEEFKTVVETTVTDEQAIRKICDALVFQGRSHTKGSFSAAEYTSLVFSKNDESYMSLTLVEGEHDYIVVVYDMINDQRTDWFCNSQLYEQICLLIDK